MKAKNAKRTRPLAEVSSSEIVRMRLAVYLLGKVWAHMRGYNLNGKRRDPLRDGDDCLRNWNALHKLVDKYHGAS